MSRQTPPRPSTLEEWLIYWENLHQGQSIDLGLQRVKAVSARFAWHINTPIITVAGTNGKGSVCAFLTAIYRAAGFSVGAFLARTFIDLMNGLRLIISQLMMIH